MVINTDYITKNMQFYQNARNVPKEAKKEFNNGRFKGTDINPMWRIQKLTELFGPCGIGWYTEVINVKVDPAAPDATIVTVDINLYVRDPDTKEWSKPIYGTGGNVLVAKGRANDEAYKMAYTDAISVACKALGIGADVYYQNDKTKYTVFTEEPGAAPTEKKPEETPAPQKNLKPDPPKMTADAAAVEDDSPVDEDPDHVSQAKLTAFMKEYLSSVGKDNHAGVAVKLKEFMGNANYKNVPDADMRKKIYDYFWNQANAIA